MASMVNRPLATMADLEALPPQVKGEIIEGVLYTQTRPRPRHAHVATRLGGRLQDAYDTGETGSGGGWWILVEPGIELPGSPEFSPDVAGWRWERLPELPEDEAITVAPDWVCEVLSPRTRSYDLGTKRGFYARIGVTWAWYVDLQARTLSVSRREGGHWLELGVHVDEQRVRAEPFPEVEIDLAELWRSRPAGR